MKPTPQLACAYALDTWSWGTASIFVPTSSFCWLFCSAICVGCFQKGDHYKHDYGKNIVTSLDMGIQIDGNSAS